MKGTAARTLLMCLCLGAGSLTAFSQDPTPETPVPGAPAGGAQRPAASQEPQPYDRVITKDAKSKKGVFTVHVVKDKYFYEIPKSELGKEFLLVTQIARTTLGVGYGGQAMGSRVIRFEQGENNRVFLRNRNYSVIADPKSPIAQAVAASNNDAILMSFPIASYGKDKDNETIVIDVSRMFATDVFEFSARQRLGATSMDVSRSFVERITPYPTNIEAEATHTYIRTAPPAGAGGGGGGQQQQTGMNPGSASVVMHYSMVKLPDNPMMPRLADDRVGYFSQSQYDYGRDEHKAPRTTYIRRWRLEKKDPSAELSEPVKPIVYYIDAATPTKWIPFMIKGVEKWQKAFEAAGFKNAIVAKLAPTKQQDPDFSAEDARYSVIRWLPSTTENASGPHIADPRTGEILESDIQFYHNIMNLQRSWYFLQAGALDPRAHKLPMPDDLMGTLLEYVVAHEVGHTLGFQHNMKASSMYPADKVRDKAWVAKMGHTPSIMDYSRFNYVAQPEDGIPVDQLVPGIGPYDVWATMWGYKPIPGARTPDAERSTLNAWALEQDKTPWLRFSTDGSNGSDPGELTEAVGDADAVKSTTLGLKNLERVSKLLVTATTTQNGDPYDDLAELYGRMLGQWGLEMNHVAAIVGGFDSQQRHIGQAGPRFTPIAKARQVEAVRFLNQNAFHMPVWALDKDVLRKIEPIGVLNRVSTAQSRVLSNLLSSTRFARVAEQAAIDGAGTYQPAELLADVRNGVWSELNAPRVTIDAYRRNLQRAYVDLANNKINPPAAPAAAAAPQFGGTPPITSGDERAWYRAELRALNAQIGTALARTTDRTTRVHLEGVRDQIGRILNPYLGAGLGGTAGRASFADLEMLEKSDVCWPDTVVKP